MSKLVFGTLEGGNAVEQAYYDADTWSRDALSAMVRDGRLGLADALKKKFAFQGRVLEMGAGRSWLTAEISKCAQVGEAWCLDLSKELLERDALVVFDLLQAREEKITRAVSNFYHVPCPDGFFDFVIFESSFHHVPDYTRLFAELRRILAPGGVVICTRERVLPTGKQERLESFHEHQNSGILERIFTLAEYRFLCELNFFHFAVDPFFWYPAGKKQWKHYVKMALGHLPGAVHRALATRMNSTIFILRPKAFRALV